MIHAMIFASAMIHMPFEAPWEAFDFNDFHRN